MNCSRIATFVGLVVCAFWLCGVQNASAQLVFADDVCREKKQAVEQARRTYLEAAMLLDIKKAEAAWRTHLSDLRRSIAGGFVMSGLDDILQTLGLPVPTSAKDKLASQRAARDKLAAFIQQAKDRSVDDLQANLTRTEQEFARRQETLRNMKCEEILKPAGCQGFAGTWRTSFGTMTFEIAGNEATSTYDFDGGKLRGTLSQGGRTLAGRYEEVDAKGTFHFTLSADGQSFSGGWTRTSGKTEPPSGKWEGTCMK
jgi:hypothetical protein